MWLVGQAVKTPPSHGGIRGSIPLRAASVNNRDVINTKHCKAMSLVRKRKCKNVIQSGVSHGRMVMRSHMNYEVIIFSAEEKALNK